MCCLDYTAISCIVLAITLQRSYVDWFYGGPSSLPADERVRSHQADHSHVGGTLWGGVSSGE